MCEKRAKGQLKITLNGRCELFSIFKLPAKRKHTRDHEDMIYSLGRINCSPQSQRQRGESPKMPHEKDYVMRFTKGNGPVTKLVEIVKIVTT
jgi:hypothetical protein